MIANEFHCCVIVGPFSKRNVIVGYEPWCDFYLGLGIE
jgi:hypothetical protein